MTCEQLHSGKHRLTAQAAQIDGARSLQKVLEEADKQLVPLVGNLVDNVWQSRPEPPQAHLRVHAMEHAGESSKDKQQRIWAECKQTVPGGVAVSLAVGLSRAGLGLMVLQLSSHLEMQTPAYQVLGASYV